MKTKNLSNAWHFALLLCLLTLWSVKTSSQTVYWIKSHELVKEIAQDRKCLILADFWAEWCGPCRMVGPIVEEVGVDYEGKAVVAKVDVDSNPGITAKYGIRNIPTILFCKNEEQ